MQTFSLAKIIITKSRQRQEFDPQSIQELVSSIESMGLLHAPVLRSTADGWQLVAGERRLKAISQIYELGGAISYDGKPVPVGEVPYTNLGELSELEAEEAELDENLKRKDLTWQEHAGAIQKLHSLRQKQAIAAGAPVHTVAETALEVSGRSDGSFQDAIRKELAVARHLDSPLLAKAKSADEAFKILKRAEQQEKHRELAAIVGETFTAETHQLRNLDACSYMRELPPASVDVILTDPPYGMGADSFGDGGGKLSGIEHHYDDSLAAWQQLMDSWCPLSYQVAKAQAHAYVFCDIERFADLKARMASAGWYVFRTPLVVYKLNSGRVPLPDQGPRRQYELVLYAIKGGKNVTHIYSDVIPSQADENMSHGAQKPVAVYQNLLQRSIKPGDVVLDSFAGSGTIFPAAHGMQCQALACEVNPEYFAMCVERLRALKAEGTAQMRLEALL